MSFIDILSNEFREIEELLRKKDPEKLSFHSRYIVMVKQEVENLALIWKRFRNERMDIAKLDIEKYRIYDKEEAGKKISKKLTKRLSEINKLESELERMLRVDLLSYFVFTDVFLSKLALFAAPFLGFDKVKSKSFSAFIKSVKKNKSRDRNLSSMYAMLGKDMEWLDSTLGFYRDKFVIHPNKPYQTWFGRSIFLPEIGFEHIKYDFNSKDEEKVSKLQKKLKDTLNVPEGGEKNPRSVVNFLAKNLFKVSDPKLREECEDIIRSIGTKSPDVINLTRRLTKFSLDFVRYLKHLLKGNDAPFGIIVTED